jgi:hypothetical protein
VSITDNRIDAVVFTNLALSVLVGLVLLYLGVRRGSWSRGLWAAAAWTTCPTAAIGVVSGSNDVVVATSVMLLLLVMTRPAWRGALVAVAASTKFLPVVLVVPLLRLRGETRRDVARYVGGLFGAVVVIFAIALRGIEALDEFWERTVVFQVGRSDIKSLWGLANVPDARHVFNAAAILLAIWCAVQWRRLSPSVAAGSIAAILALVIGALPQYWGSYSVWFVPAVLVAMLWRGQEPVDDAADSDAADTIGERDAETETRTLSNA